MPERLKQIWSGFEGATSRRLTGSGVDNIAVPHREQSRADGAAGADPIAAPAAAAFEALKERLAASAKRSAKRKGAARDTAPPETAFAPDSGAARDLVRGLKATEARLARSERLYGEGAPASKKRGLFGPGKLKNGKSRKRFILF